jgi:hypothetical protein
MSSTRITKMFLPYSFASQSFATSGGHEDVARMVDLYMQQVLNKPELEIEEGVLFSRYNLWVLGVLFFVYDKAGNKMACSYVRRWNNRASVSVSCHGRFWGYYALFKVEKEMQK